MGLADYLSEKDTYPYAALPALDTCGFQQHVGPTWSYFASIIASQVWQWGTNAVGKPLLFVGIQQGLAGTAWDGSGPVKTILKNLWETQPFTRVANPSSLIYLVVIHFFDFTIMFTLVYLRCNPFLHYHNCCKVCSLDRSSNQLL